MKKKLRITVITVIVIMIATALVFKAGMDPVSKNEDIVKFVVEQGDTYSNLASN